MADFTNLVTNPRGAATSGTVEVRRNLVPAPRGVTGTAHFQARWGWAASLVSGIVDHPYGITQAFRITAPSAPSSGSTRGVDHGANLDIASPAITYPVTAGATYTVSSTVRSSHARTSVMQARFWDGSAWIAANITGTTVTLTPGGWHTITLTTTAPAGATGVGFRSRLDSPDSNYVEGETFDVTAVIVSTESDYMDGSYSPDPDLTPEWTGAVDNSASRLVGPMPVGWTGAYYSASRDRIAAMPGGATYTLAADPGPATLVVETETDTSRSPHTGTAVTVTEEDYFRAAVVAGDYTGPYFDGDTPDTRGIDGYGWVYEWTGAPDASTSTADYGPRPGIAVEPITDPVPAVGVTVTGLDTEAPSIVTVERAIPGEGWVQVPGMVRRSVTGGMYEIDYACPLQVQVTYRLTVEGAVQPDGTEAVITVTSDVCWLQDPVNPYTGVGVEVGRVNGNAPFFLAGSFASLTRVLPGTVQQVVGAGTPVGMGGTRQAPSGVPMTVATQDMEQANRLRTLLTTAYPLMLRVVPPLTQIPPVVFLHAEVEEQPRFDVAPYDGSYERWVLQGQAVRPPRFRVLVPRWTYGDVQPLWETYEQATLVGGTYLDWVRDPTPGGGA